MKKLFTAISIILFAVSVSGQTTITDQAGNKYSGAFIKTDFTGKGACVYSSGDKYTGAWKNGVFDGSGTFTWKNGDYYEGEWVDGIKHGTGKLWVAASKESYEGTWLNDLLAEGSYNKNDTFIYKGGWKDNLYSGKGYLVLRSNAYYEEAYSGGFTNGKKDGEAAIMTVNIGPEKTLINYRGNFTNDEMYYGKITYPGDVNYEGQIKNFLPHGYGISSVSFDKTTGKKYIELWVDGKRQEGSNYAPDFSAPAPDGSMISLKPSLGKYTVLFFGSSAAVCKEYHTILAGLYKNYQDKGLQIIEVSLDSDKTKWQNAIRDQQLVWRQVSHLRSFNDPVAILYHVQSYPYCFILDEDGKFIAKGLRGEELKKYVQALFP